MRRGTNSRAFEHGLLVSIQKSILADIRRNNSTKAEFADEIGICEGTLINKWTNSCKVNDFTLHEFIHIVELTGDISPLEYICHMFDLAVVCVYTEGNITPDLLNKLSDEAQIECNESFAQTKRASEDGIYTFEEVEAMKKEAIEAIEAKQKELDAIRKIVPVDLDFFKEEE